MSGERFKHFLLVISCVLITTSCMAVGKSDPEPTEWGQFPMMWIVAMFVVMSALVGLLLVIYLLAKQYHVRAMAMIAKGIFEPRPINWPFLMLAAGCLLIFLTPGIILMFLSENDIIYSLGLAIFLSMGGIALLLIGKLAKKSKTEKSN